MKIAIPTSDGVLCPHFGHCQEFTIINVDTSDKTITDVSTIIPPPHEPGVLPVWLGQQGCNLIIAGGIGQRAIGMFHRNGINVVTGAPSDKPEKLAAAYLNSALMTGRNLCDDADFHAGGHTDCKNHK